MWDLIRDFFVQHVFGGTLSNGNYIHHELGSITTYANGVEDDFANLTPIYSKVGHMGDYDYYISLNDWLSTTATAISITIIVVLCCLFIYKIIKLIGGLIR